MIITDVRIRPISNGGKLRAIASVTFDEEFVVHDLKLIEGLNGFFIAMPSKKNGDEFRDVAHPLKSETRERIKEAVVKSYTASLELNKAGEAVI